MTGPRMLWRSGLLLATTVVIGCSSPDERLTQLSQQSLARQAEQNRQMAAQTEEIASATNVLVGSDALARADLIAANRVLQLSLQAERATLDERRHSLEQDRKRWDETHHLDSVLATALEAAVSLLAALLPLMLCVYLVRALARGELDQEINDLLVYELTGPEHAQLAINARGGPREEPPSPPGLLTTEPDSVG